MSAILQALLLALIGNSLIYSGIAFINGILLPVTLQLVYRHTTVLHRVLVMTLLFSTLANFIFSRVYKITDPANAGMVILGTLVVVLVTKAVWLEGGGFNGRVTLATAVLILAAAWVSYELHSIKS